LPYIVFTRSRRLTDKIDLHRKLLNQCIVRRDFFAEITIGQDHLVEGVTQHRPAFIEIGALPVSVALTERIEAQVQAWRTLAGRWDSGRGGHYLDHRLREGGRAGHDDR